MSETEHGLHILDRDTAEPGWLTHSHKKQTNITSHPIRWGMRLAQPANIGLGYAWNFQDQKRPPFKEHTASFIVFTHDKLRDKEAAKKRDSHWIGRASTNKGMHSLASFSWEKQVFKRTSKVRADWQRVTSLPPAYAALMPFLSLWGPQVTLGKLFLRQPSNPASFFAGEFWCHSGFCCSDIVNLK